MRNLVDGVYVAVERNFQYNPSFGDKCQLRLLHQPKHSNVNEFCASINFLKMALEDIRNLLLVSDSSDYLFQPIRTLPIVGIILVCDVSILSLWIWDFLYYTLF